MLSTGAAVVPHGLLKITSRSSAAAELEYFVLQMQQAVSAACSVAVLTCRAQLSCHPDLQIWPAADVLMPLCQWPRMHL